MSAETPNWLRNNILVGFTEKRGDAWWNSRGFAEDMSVDDNGEPNHYTGAIPLEDVNRRILNFEIVASELYVPNIVGGQDDPEFVALPNRIVTRRSDTGDAFGVFSDGYVIHQPREFADTIANILDDDVQVGSVGNLKGGAVSWVSVEVPENITTPEGVEFRPNLFAMTSHDGTMPTIFKRCVTNIVCDNTLRAAAGEAGQELRVKHTAKSGFAIANARQTLAVVHSAADDFAAEVAALAAVKVNARQFSKFLDLWSPVPDEADAPKRAVTLSENRRATLTNLWKSDVRVQPWAGTAWGIVQAVNTFDQHFASVHTAGDTAASVRQAARWQRSILAVADGSLDRRTESTRALALAAAGQ